MQLQLKLRRCSIGCRTLSRSHLWEEFSGNIFSKGSYRSNPVIMGNTFSDFLNWIGILGPPPEVGCIRLATSDNFAIASDGRATNGTIVRMERIDNLEIRRSRHVCLCFRSVEATTLIWRNLNGSNRLQHYKQLYQQCCWNYYRIARQPALRRTPYNLYYYGMCKFQVVPT